MKRCGVGRRYSALILAGIVLSTACKRAPATGQSSAGSLRLPMPPAPSSSSHISLAANDPALERVLDKHYGNDTAKKAEFRGAMHALDAQIDAEIKLAEINHRTMVVPALPDFKPEPIDRKVRLRLILEKTKIHPGDFLRFRLEMTNVGRQAIDFVEFNSGLFKSGGMNDTDRISFYVTDSRGRREKLDGTAAKYKVRERNEKHPESKFEFPPDPRPKSKSEFEFLPDSMSKKDKEKWFEETAAMSAASTVFKVKLLPGETLRSRGDWESTGETFRTLWCEQDFERKGGYKLEVVLDDRPTPLTKSFIDWNLKTGSTLMEIHEFHDRRVREALGPVSSNSVIFEVVR